MGWWLVAYWVSTLIVSELIRPKVRATDVSATNSDTVEMPQVSSTNPVPVVWGKVRVKEPNLVWYGDYLAIPIKKVAGHGGFLGTGHAVWQTVGYRYYWGQQLAICHGPVTVSKIWAEEKLLWSGSSTGGGIIIDNEGLYGGEDSGGGVAALCAFYPGNQTQTKDQYLVKKLGNVPTYRGVAYLVWYGPSVSMSIAKTWFSIPKPPNKGSGYIGTAALPRSLSFEVARYPGNLVPAKAQIGADANPAEIIYECLTTDPNGPDGWGMGLSASLIDVASFTTIAGKLYDEGFGISMLWSDQTSVEDVIAEVCKVIDAVCYRDFRTGLYTMKLIRGGYDVSTLPVLDESNIIELENYSQAGIDGTTNDITVKYNDRSLNYKDTEARAQDLANMRTQGDIISASFDYKTITTASLADRVANRELFAACNPIAKCDVVVNRQNYSYGPGDLFVLKWNDLGITNIVMRVQKVAVGMPKANCIHMSLVQDVFNIGSATYQVPGGGGTVWLEPVVSPTAITNQKVVELPYWFNKDETLASYMVGGERPNTSCVTFDVWQKLHAAADDQYIYKDSCLTYTPVGYLRDAYNSPAGVDSVGFAITGGIDLANLSSAAESEIRNGKNLAMFENGEIIAFQDTAQNLDGSTQVTGVWGGLIDAVPSAHSAGEKVWFFSYGAVNPIDKVSQTAWIDVKNLPCGPRGTLLLADVPVVSCQMASRNTKPYPPGNMQVNGLVRPGSILGTCTPSWSARNRKVETQIMKQTDGDDASLEGNYTAQVVVNGVVKQTYQNLNSGSLIALRNAGPTFTPGIVGKANGGIVVSSSSEPLYSGNGVDCLFYVSSGGLTIAHGSANAAGFVNGDATTSRYHWPQQILQDTSGNLYILDNHSYIRRIRASDNNSETFVDLSSYGDIFCIAIDGSNNLYAFAGSQRLVIKITQARTVTVLAGSKYFDSNTEQDGTGENASFRYCCLIAADASGNVWVADTPGYGNGTKIRYVTSAGVVTTPGTINNYPGWQIACVGSDVYYGDSASPKVHKCTPDGSITDFATHPDGFLFYCLSKDNQSGGHLAYVAYGPGGSGLVEYGRITSAGVIQPLYRYIPQTGYSAAQRIADDANGSHLVEIKVKQVVGSNESAQNSTGQFLMSGFGMCFGLAFGGKQQ